MALIMYILLEGFEDLRKKREAKRYNEHETREYEYCRKSQYKIDLSALWVTSSQADSSEDHTEYGYQDRYNHQRRIDLIGTVHGELPGTSDRTPCIGVVPGFKE